MAEFSAGAVIAMFGVVEATVITLYLNLDRKTADDEDVDEVETTAEKAIEKARAVEREAADAHRRIDDLATDGGPRDDA